MPCIHKSGNFHPKSPELSIPPIYFQRFFSRCLLFYIDPSYRSYIIREVANTTLILINDVPQIDKV